MRSGLDAACLTLPRDDLDPQPVGVTQVRGVVAPPVLRALPGRPVVAAAVGEPGGVGGVDGRLAAGAERDVSVAGAGVRPRTTIHSCGSLMP